MSHALIQRKPPTLPYYTTLFSSAPCYNRLKTLKRLGMWNFVTEGKSEHHHRRHHQLTRFPPERQKNLGTNETLRPRTSTIYKELS